MKEKIQMSLQIFIYIFMKKPSDATPFFPNTFQFGLYIGSYKYKLMRQMYVCVYVYIYIYIYIYI